MNKIGNFFKTIGHDIKAVLVGAAQEADKILVALFGKKAATDFVTAAENLLETDFGKVILDAAAEVLVDVQSGKGVSLGSAASSLTQTILNESKSAGIEVGESLAAMLANLAIAKVQGGLPAASAVTGTSTAASEVAATAEPTS